ncbi:MAG: hypothetical protein DRI81_19350 [Chloroflexi bacterium]|nr:MAG: hypothetical protein DRI81_19350 [Chloroflexota bacterium]
MAQLYTKKRLAKLAEVAKLTEDEVLEVLENQRADLATVAAWVGKNEGTTVEEALGNAWLPESAPDNAEDVVAVAVAARLVVQVGRTARDIDGRSAAAPVQA